MVPDGMLAESVLASVAAVWDFLNESVIDLYNGIRGGHCHINSFVGFQCGNNVIQNPLAH